MADRLGIRDVYPWADQEAAINDVLDHPATGHATVASMRANGGRARLKISHVAYPSHAFDTPSGKIEFRSDRAAGMGLPALPSPPEAMTDDADLPLAFAHGRTFAHFHAFYDHARALPTLAAREQTPELWLSPQDADSRGISNGAVVRMFNQRGCLEVTAKITKRIPAGTVWMRDGWPGLNALTRGDAVLPEAALTAFPFSVGQSSYHARVEVEAV